MDRGIIGSGWKDGSFFRTFLLIGCCVLHEVKEGEKGKKFDLIRSGELESEKRGNI